MKVQESTTSLPSPNTYEAAVCTACGMSTWSTPKAAPSSVLPGTIAHHGNRDVSASSLVQIFDSLYKPGGSAADVSTQFLRNGPCLEALCLVPIKTENAPTFQWIKPPFVGASLSPRSHAGLCFSVLTRKASRRARPQFLSRACT